MVKGKFQVADEIPQGAVIKVVGVGGCGGNAIRHMIHSGIDGANFYCINTDAQDLCKLNAGITEKRGKGKEVGCLQIGRGITKGLGAGADPEVGRKAALEDEDRIIALLQGADMVFIASGMGGGTGTGAAPVVAAIAKKQGILTVAVVTRPFKHENRMRIADQGLAELSRYVDTVIVVSNDKLLEVLGSNVPLLDAFAAADDVLLGAVQGIADLIIRPGIVNVDFADVQAVMLGKGNAMMGTGTATGENRAEQATLEAIKSPLLEDLALNSAKGVLINVTANEDLTIGEYQQICSLIKEQYATKGAQVVNGTVIDHSIGDAIKVTVVVTGVFPISAAEASAGRQQEAANEDNLHGPVDRQPVQPPLISTCDNAGNGMGAQGAISVDWDQYRQPALLRTHGDESSA